MNLRQSPEVFWQAPIALHLITINPRCVIRNRPPQWHQHLFYELGMVLEGSCEWALDHTVTPVHAGEALLVAPTQRHAEYVGGASCSMIWIGFDANRPAPSWSHRAIALGDDLQEVVQIARQIQKESLQKERFAQERMELLLQTLLLLISRHALGAEGEGARFSPLNRRQSACMESAALYFRQNLADCLSIAQVAAYYSLCPAYFSRLFQQHHAISPGAYLHRARLEHSAHLLRESALSVKEIARRCGFSDSAHFCKAFKKYTLRTPGAYREGR